MRLLHRLLALASAAGVTAALAVIAPGANAASSQPPVADPAALVNPMIGTGKAATGGSVVNEFPGPDMPFGMIQWGPDTANPRANGSGYNYSANQLLGFSLDRLSGAGCPVYGDVPILPTVGAIGSDPADVTADFSHASESAQAGYYRVTSTAADGSDPVTTELATAMRSGIARFTFPASTQADLLLKVADSAEKLANGVPKYQKVFATTTHVAGDDAVTGSITGGNFCNTGADAHPNYTLYFDIVFSQPFTASGTWPGGPGTDPGGVSLTFDTTESPTVTARVGISYTSAANAALNLATEIPGWDFDTVRQDSVQAWNSILSRIQVTGGTTDQQTDFYTALYHSLLDPHVYSDVNGEYTGMDGQVHTTAPGHAQYADYSGWDVYRDEVQLLALLSPARTSDMVQSMLNDDAQDGMLPKWAQGNGESYEMVGDPADAIIADAYAFGARGFDTGQALTDMIAEATQASSIRPGQQVLDQYGYLASNLASSAYGCCAFSAPVSTQLEYDTADYAIAAFANALRQRSAYTAFATRAQNWQNAFNPATGYAQAKQSSGQWAPGFTPGTGTGFVEGTAAQYTPMIPFNMGALIAARGGSQAWNTFLDSLLANITSPGPTNADVSNEEDLLVPWQYDYTGEPWKTQQEVRQIQTQLYANSPSGEPGNDDLGTMSSWYVWSALGLYPATPGTDVLVVGSPVFPHAVVRLGSGDTITVDAPNAAADAPYVDGLRLGGDAWPKLYLTAAQYAHGAQLEFDLATTPGTWGSGPSAAPPSDGTGQAPVLPFLTSSAVAVAPGQQAIIGLSARNLTGSPVTATATTASPAGVCIAPAATTMRVPASGTASVQLIVSVPAGTAAGTYMVPITLTAGPNGPPRQVTLALTVGAP